jgi:hypothetical protein
MTEEPDNPRAKRFKPELIVIITLYALWSRVGYDIYRIFRGIGE